MAAAVFSTYGLPPISLVAHDTALRIGADFRSAAEPDPLPSERDNHILTAHGRLHFGRGSSFLGHARCSGLRRQVSGHDLRYTRNVGEVIGKEVVVRNLDAELLS